MIAAQMGASERLERPERTKLARQWLAKAEEDLIAARHLLTLADEEADARVARARLETVGRGR